MNNHERLDGYNGLLLAPHIDHLFDRGYISFSDDGGQTLSPRVDKEQLARMGVPIAGEFNVGSFTPEQCQYLAFHRENVFLEEALRPCRTEFLNPYSKVT